MNKYNIVVDEVEYEIIPVRAGGIAAIANIIGRLTLDGRKVLKELKTNESGDFIFAILAALNEDSLLKLGQVLTGFSREFVEEKFALDWLTDALVFQFEHTNLRGVIANFSRLVSQTQT